MFIQHRIIKWLVKSELAISANFYQSFHTGGWWMRFCGDVFNKTHLVLNIRLKYVCCRDLLIVFTYLISLLHTITLCHIEKHASNLWNKARQVYDCIIIWIHRDQYLLILGLLFTIMFVFHTFIFLFIKC